MHNMNAARMKKEVEQDLHVPEQGNITITPQELAETITHTHSWKWPGIDNIQNFWYKFTSTYEGLDCQINDKIIQLHTLLKFFTPDITDQKM